ncbi:MAG: OmpH family outer membrane protein [Betaproteobacteria bacterium]|nr:OmpH family outer membrane protein [Betaproteobacteria bacterium]
MKVRALPVLALVLMGVSQLALADAAKIGFVNSERVMRESAPAVRAQQRIEKDFSKRDQELQRMAKDMDALQKELENENSKMSTPERQAKERSLADLNRDFQRKKREFGEDLNQRRNEELASIIERTNQVIKQIAESDKYDVVLQDVVYANPRIDITDKVLKALADTK